MELRWLNHKEEDHLEARDSDAKEPEASLEEVPDTRRQELDLFQIFLANSYYNSPGI